MASDNKQSAIHPGESTEVVDTPDRRDEGDRLAALYGLTPKVESAIVAAITAGAEDRARALVAPLHPADRADLLERLPAQQAAALVLTLGDGLDAHTLAFLDENTRDEIVDVMGVAALARQLPALDTDDAVNIIEELEQGEIEDVLAALPAEDRVLVEEGLAYPEDSAGRMMQREIVTVPSFWTIGQTIDFLRSSQFGDTDFYLIFVVDPARSPIGEISLGKLLCTPRLRRVGEIMQGDFRKIPADMDQEEVAILFRRYALHEGSGGAGEFRGGFGLDYEVELRRGEARASFVMDHGRFGPQGAAGGQDGGSNKITVWRDGAAHVPDHLSKEQDIPLKAGDRVRVQTPGGGGYGDPKARSADDVREDIRLGRYSAAEATALFGYVES